MRTIASHTCKDIYHLKIDSFSFLLIIADDCQDWGRKNISELYVTNKPKYEFENIVIKFSEDNKTNFCSINENFTFDFTTNCTTNCTAKVEVKRILENLKKQFDDYSSIFRDGQDTKNRNFTFSKKCDITIKTNNGNIKYIVNYKVSNDSESIFKITLNSSDIDRDEQEYGNDMLLSVFYNFLESEEIEEENKPKKNVIKANYIENLGSDSNSITYKLRLYNDVF